MAGRLSSAISSGLVHPLLLLLFGLAVSYVGNEDLARHRQTSRKDSLGNPIGIGPLPIHAFRTSYKRMIKVGNKSTQKEHQGVKRQAHDKPTTSPRRNDISRQELQVQRVQRAWRPFMWLGESKPKVSWAPRIAASETLQDRDDGDTWRHMVHRKTEKMERSSESMRISHLRHLRHLRSHYPTR